MLANNKTGIFYLETFKYYQYEGPNGFFYDGKFYILFKNIFVEKKCPINNPRKDDICSICFNKKNHKTGLNGCSHTFCFVCIYLWSKTKKSCPLCRANFKRFLKYI